MKPIDKTDAPQRDAKAALAVLEQMFAYFSYEAPPLEKPVARAA